MYRPLWERCLMGCTPFHQSVLYSNYMIPKEKLLLLLDEMTQVCKVRSLFTCEDRMEDGLFQREEPQQVPNHQGHFVWEPLPISTEPGVWYGFFDAAYTFYVRVYLEPEEEVSAMMEQCGMLEFYGADKLVERILETLRRVHDGFFLQKGAKQHVREIIF